LATGRELERRRAQDVGAHLDVVADLREIGELQLDIPLAPEAVLDQHRNDPPLAHAGFEHQIGVGDATAAAARIGLAVRRAAVRTAGLLRRAQDRAGAGALPAVHAGLPAVPGVRPRLHRLA